MKDDKMVSAYGTYNREEKCIKGFWLKNMKKTTQDNYDDNIK
jgi:hypothetical protein